ncbi:hypothetical protein bAD24_III09280 [Burkholderia sp. AD24]|nr:hypothetical protein bAD24_III09280 [Burkholderia sp. AD24]
MSTEPFAHSPPLAADLVSQLAGLHASGSVAALRAARADATRYTQGSHDALFSPDVADLTLVERLYAAWYAAWLTPSVTTAQAYRERLLDASGDAVQHVSARLAAIETTGVIATATDDPRLSAILAHTHALITQPAAAGKAELDALVTAGLSTRAIVALAQLVAFVSYQVRVVAALKAFQALEQTA